MIITIYTSLLGLIFIILSFRTLRLRRKLRIAVGDSGNVEMLRAIRAHSNFAEYAPFSLFLIFLVENSGCTSFLIHILGSMLLLGRIVHAYGISQVDEKFQYRVSGMASTFFVIGACSLYLLYHKLF